jgi:D-3-phosphoglycerate dehydrogenase
MTKKWKVVLYEEMHKVGTEYLRERAEVVISPKPDEETVIPLAQDADAVIIRANGKITKRLLENAPQLKVVGRHGVGLETIDREEATRRGIWVVYTPEANAMAVAEHALGMILALTRKMPLVDQEVRRGAWEVRYRFLGKQIHGRTLGVIGLGRIGRNLATMCRKAFEMRVMYYDKIRSPEMEEQLPCEFVPLDELLAEADVVSIHAPQTPETIGLLNEERIAKMKPGAILINAARGGIVDENALAKALQEGRLFGAGLDVFSKEPPDTEHPIFQAENVLTSAHMAAHTEEAMIAMSMVAEDIIRVLEGEKPKYPANKPV